MEEEVGLLVLVEEAEVGGEGGGPEQEAEVEEGVVPAR